MHALPEMGWGVGGANFKVRCGAWWCCLILVQRDIRLTLLQNQHTVAPGAAPVLHGNRGSKINICLYLRRANPPIALFQSLYRSLFAFLAPSFFLCFKSLFHSLAAFLACKACSSPALSSTAGSSVPMSVHCCIRPVEQGHDRGAISVARPCVAVVF